MGDPLSSEMELRDVEGRGTLIRALFNLGEEEGAIASN